MPNSFQYGYLPFDLHEERWLAQYCTNKDVESNLCREVKTRENTMIQHWIKENFKRLQHSIAPMPGLGGLDLTIQPSPFNNKEVLSD